MKSVYLMRHGQTLFNVQHKIQGFCDSPLTPLGIKQAKTIKTEYFAKNNILLDEAHCSTSERAIDTLKIVTDLPFKRIKICVNGISALMRAKVSISIRLFHIKTSLFNLVVNRRCNW